MVGFPLLLIPLAIYNIVVWLMPGVSMTDPLFNVPLMSGAAWPVTLADILLAIAMLLLLLEVIRGARPGAKFVMDHLLSFVVFAAAAAEFLLLPKFASSTFFLLTLLALVDFLAGLAQRARRPRQQHAHAGAVGPSRRAPPAEPRFEAPPPAAAREPPSPASAVETVPTEYRAPAPEEPGTAQEREPSGGATEGPERGTGVQ